jgi:hypothetical protein
MNKLFVAPERLLNCPKRGMLRFYQAEQLAHLWRHDERRANQERTIVLPPKAASTAKKDIHASSPLAGDNSVTVPFFEPLDGADSCASTSGERRTLPESRIVPGEEYGEHRPERMADPRTQEWRSRKEGACIDRGNRPTGNGQTDCQSSVCRWTLVRSQRVILKVAVAATIHRRSH